MESLLQTIHRPKWRFNNELKLENKINPAEAEGSKILVCRTCVSETVERRELTNEDIPANTHRTQYRVQATTHRRLSKTPTYR